MAVLGSVVVRAVLGCGLFGLFGVDIGSGLRFGCLVGPTVFFGMFSGEG